MKKLKPGEKFCPECKGVNPIRAFQCKDCDIKFLQKPKKEKPAKENKSEYKIDTFFKKFVELKKDKILIDKEVNLVPEAMINLDILIQNLINSVYKNYTSVTASKENILKCDMEKESINLAVDNSFKLSSDFSFNVLNSENLENNILGAIVYHNPEFNKIIINCLFFENLVQNEKDNCINLKDNINFWIEKENSNDFLKISVKFLNNTPIFLVSIDNEIYLFLYYNSKIFKISEVCLKDYVDKIDIILANDYFLKILVTDIENRILLYTIDLEIFKNFDLNSSNVVKKEYKIELRVVYDKEFTSKITDLKFLPFSEEVKSHIENKNLTRNFFCATSRDSTVKIFETINPKNILFRYKCNDIWLTKLIFHMEHKLMFLIPNLDEKVIGIKFHGDKEPLIKRLPDTEKAIFCFLDNKKEKFYFLNSVGEIKYFDEKYVHLTYKNSKSRGKVDFKIGTLYDNKLDGKYYSHFYFKNDILIIPFLNEIKIINTK